MAVKAPPVAPRPAASRSCMVPFWTNFLVRTIGWQVILAPEGWLSTLLQEVGLIARPARHPVHAHRGAHRRGLQLPAAHDPAAVRRVRPRRTGRCARRRRTSARAAGRRSSGSRCRSHGPGIIAGVLLVFIPLMGDYITATVLGGAKGNMVGQLVASQFQTAQNWALGSAMAVLLILVIMRDGRRRRGDRLARLDAVPRPQPARAGRSAPLRRRRREPADGDGELSRRATQEVRRMKQISLVGCRVDGVGHRSSSSSSSRRSS